MSKETTAKELRRSILKESFNKNVKPFSSTVPEFKECEGEKGYDWIYEAMEAYANKRVAEALEDISEILENVTYWDVCPEDYKERIEAYLTK